MGQINNRNLGSPPTTQAQNKPEDKDSPEYKKKQALLAGPVINMSYSNNGGYGMPESLFTALKDIFEAAVVSQSRNGIIRPYKFLDILKKENEMFRTAMHQDAHEFLNLLLNTVVENVDAYAKKAESEKQEKHEEPTGDASLIKQESPTVSFPSFLPNPKSGQPNTRMVHELFEGTLTSETRCLTCENVSQRDEPFLDLSVDLEQHSSVTSCLRRFSEEEMLCERNKFHCDNCGGLQEAEKRMKIKRLPKILALHLKRFKYTEDLQRLQKLFHKVVFPYQLRLFNTTDDAEDPDRLYELYAIVVHIGGGPYHGHYVAIIKTEDRGWFLFDDEMVEPVDKSFVQNFFGGQTGNAQQGLACAYVLFYQETTLEAVRKEQAKEETIRASVEETIGLGLRGTNGSVDVHRIKSAEPQVLPQGTGQFASLDHAMTAPAFSPEVRQDNPVPPAIPVPPIPTSPKPLSKKERAKEEKERKAEEKEREKEAARERIEKQRVMRDRLIEIRKQQEEELKQAMEASKISKAAEDKRAPAENGDKESSQNGAAVGGLDRFRRSKSLRFSSLGSRKEKTASVVDENQNPAIDESPEPSKEKDKDKDKDKKSNRFSIRKKSFGFS